MLNCIKCCLFYRLLSLHPTLKHLYEDLVITKVLSSEEYWNTPTIKQYTDSQSEKQEIGNNKYSIIINHVYLFFVVVLVIYRIKKVISIVSFLIYFRNAKETFIFYNLKCLSF